jgi:hypothetical protein
MCVPQNTWKIRKVYFFLSKHGIPCELHINPGCDNSHKLCKIHTQISEFIDITDAYPDYGISILTDF